MARQQLVRRAHVNQRRGGEQITRPRLVEQIQTHAVAKQGFVGGPELQQRTAGSFGPDVFDVAVVVVVRDVDVPVTDVT